MPDWRENQKEGMYKFGAAYQMQKLRTNPSKISK